MAETGKSSINRKEFMTKAGAGLVGLGVSGCSLRNTARKSVDTPKGVRTLGGTGLTVSAVGFGATRTDQPNVMRNIVDRGVNFIDTGRMYSEGRNEELIGRVLEGIRDRIVIQSKFHRDHHGDPAAIERSIEESMVALRTDYIDIMLFRWPRNPDELLSETVEEAFDHAREKGKIRFTGFSTHENQADYLDTAVKAGFYDVALIAYNHAGSYIHPNSGRYYEWDQASVEAAIGRASSAGMGIVAMKTCAGGPRTVPDTEEKSYTAAIAKVLDNPYIDTTVPAMANFRQADENLRAVMS